MIKNPYTGRMIQVGGSTHKKLIRQIGGITHSISDSDGGNDSDNDNDNRGMNNDFITFRTKNRDDENISLELNTDDYFDEYTNGFYLDIHNLDELARDPLPDHMNSIFVRRDKRLEFANFLETMARTVRDLEE